MIRGIGIDVIEISRIEGAIGKWGDRFLNRVFSETEISYCRNRNFGARHYAARFAAKEACLKSLGIGLGMGLSLKNISVVNNEKGKPELLIDKDLQPILKESQTCQFYLSMSHTREYASAIVVVELRGSDS